MAKPITPLLAADAIIELVDRPDKPIVLIERAFPPLGWAIPGGFVDIGETLEHAAIREAKEETGLD
ncbi:MAG: NUDIX domain-containing protein, partial [Methylicorpusculum sp.]|nr:NUDIX domain-containing protein [Methylicorpusculum sp.]